MFTIINIIGACRDEVAIHHEEACKLRQRRLLIRFCQDVLSGQNKEICTIIDAYDFSMLNVGEMKLTRDTFVASFKSVCEELFRLRPPRISFIIVVFAYALELHEHHQGIAWYEPDLLILSLTDVLISNGFEVYISNRCTLL